MLDQPPSTLLAHFNWATLIGAPGSPEVAPFFAAVPRVNALAERSPGFVWRDGDEAHHGTQIGWPLFSDNPRMIASFSVWQSPAHLADYVYKTVHGAFFRRAREWFVPGQGGHVLWWIPAGQIPDMTEARARVERLLSDGPSESAFSFAALGLGPYAGETGETLPSRARMQASRSVAIE